MRRCLIALVLSLPVLGLVQLPKLQIQEPTPPRRYWYYQHEVTGDWYRCLKPARPLMSGDSKLVSVADACWPLAPSADEDRDWWQIRVR